MRHPFHAHVCYRQTHPASTWQQVLSSWPGMRALNSGLLAQSCSETGPGGGKGPRASPAPTLWGWAAGDPPALPASAPRAGC